MVAIVVSKTVTWSPLVRQEKGDIFLLLIPVVILLILLIQIQDLAYNEREIYRSFFYRRGRDDTR